MNIDYLKREPTTKDQLEYVKNEIKRIYLFLNSHTGHDPQVIEVMKLSALADVQRRYEAGEPW